MVLLLAALDSGTVRQWAHQWLVPDSVLVFLQERAAKRTVAMWVDPLMALLWEIGSGCGSVFVSVPSLVMAWVDTNFECPHHSIHSTRLAHLTGLLHKKLPRSPLQCLDKQHIPHLDISRRLLGKTRVVVLGYPWVEVSGCMLAEVSGYTSAEVSGCRLAVVWG